MPIAMSFLNAMCILCIAEIIILYFVFVFVLFRFVSATVLKTCSDGLCENGATCTDISWGGVICQCVLGYAGHLCERT